MADPIRLTTKTARWLAILAHVRHYHATIDHLANTPARWGVTRGTVLKDFNELDELHLVSWLPSGYLSYPAAWEDGARHQKRPFPGPVRQRIADPARYCAFRTHRAIQALRSARS